MTLRSDPRRSGVSELIEAVDQVHGDQPIQALHGWVEGPTLYGGSFVARCACGHVSGFFLNPHALLASTCERQQLEGVAADRAALVGWSR